MITKEQFKRYVEVQMSGRTNMFMVSNVMALSGLTKEQCIEIMKTYAELDAQYPEVKKQVN